MLSDAITKEGTAGVEDRVFYKLPVALYKLDAFTMVPCHYKTRQHNVIVLLQRFQYPFMNHFSDIAHGGPDYSSY